MRFGRRAGHDLARLATDELGGAVTRRSVERGLVVERGWLCKKSSTLKIIGPLLEAFDPAERRGLDPNETFTFEGP